MQRNRNRMMFGSMSESVYRCKYILAVSSQPQSALKIHNYHNINNSFRAYIVLSNVIARLSL
jgi:hypothetical protein